MQTYDTIIIGAGVAGLAAAQSLTKTGSKVIVLEAQSYVGGRVKTVEYSGWGAPVELGAAFIHGANVITANMARELGLELVHTREDRTVVDSNGHVLDHDQKQPYYELLDYIDTAGKQGVSVQEIINRNPVTKDETIRQLAALSVGDYEAGDAENLDSGAWSEMVERTDHNGDNLLIKESYQPIITMLSEGIDIRLNSVVSSVDTSQQDKVVVILNDGDRFEAKNIIITVSIGVLQHKEITFIPSLPSTKIAAIQKFEMGNAMKLVLRFENPHNISRYLNYGDGDNVLLQTITGWWPSPADPQVLTGFTGGSRAKAALALNEERLIEKVTDDLRKISKNMFDNKIIDYKVIRWDTNPYTYGAYSNHPVGTTNGMREELAAPIDNRIFWAGEATASDGNYATVHGAISSGYRAADEIIAVRY